MSADNWTLCPFCTVLKDAEVEAERDRVNGLYGTVPVEEFDQSRILLSVLETVPRSNTWREDYELGVEGNEFYVSYRGACSECGNVKKFEHHEDLL